VVRVLLVAGVVDDPRGTTVTSHLSIPHRRSEFHAGLESMTAAELLGATRRALSTIYTPQQTAIWLDAHASGDPVAVARKALRLCGLETPLVTSGLPTGGERRGPGVARSVLADLTEPHAARGPVAVSEHVALEVQQMVTEAIRTLFTCQDPRDLHEVLLEVVGRLGGEVLPAGDAGVGAIDVDLSLGMGPPLLATPDPQRPELAEHLQAHLPQLVDDARQALGGLERHKLLASATERDSLTGLLNRRAYDGLAEGASPGDVLVLVDLDGFRQVNHAHGHLAGDQVLRIFGAVLQAQLRVSEQALRLGGDEFLIVLRQPDPEAATRLLERLRAAWEQRRPLPVDFSTGVASVTCSTDAALRAADQHLYQDRRSPPAA
jgi:diguanylate cyclase (GGDEF)-like protein